MEYVIEANSWLLWASVLQLAGCALVLAAAFMASRFGLAMGWLGTFAASLFLTDIVNACAITICVVILWPKKDKKNPGLKNRDIK